MRRPRLATAILTGPARNICHPPVRIAPFVRAIVGVLGDAEADIAAWRTVTGEACAEGELWSPTASQRRRGRLGRRLVNGIPESGGD